MPLDAVHLIEPLLRLVVLIQQPGPAGGVDDPAILDPLLERLGRRRQHFRPDDVDSLVRLELTSGLSATSSSVIRSTGYCACRSASHSALRSSLLTLYSAP